MKRDHHMIKSGKTVSGNGYVLILSAGQQP